MWALAPFEALAPRICAWMIKKGRENVCVKGGCTCSESICGNVMWVRCALLRGACAEYMYFGSMSANSALRGACAERLCTSTHRSGARQRLGSICFHPCQAKRIAPFHTWPNYYPRMNS